MMDTQIIDHPPADSTSTDIALVVSKDPGIVLLDDQKFNAWYDKLKAKAPTGTDMTTRKDREALRSFAAEVRSEKAAIDKARLRLTKGWRDMTDQANAAGKDIAGRLESLAVEVRQPLTDWEEAEKARVDECEATIAQIGFAGIVRLEDTSATVRARGAELFLIEIDPERFGDLYQKAVGAKDLAVTTLKTAMQRLLQEEADRAELARLRAENEKREARETAEREEVERKEREAADAKAAEEARKAAEQAEADRIAQAERNAAEQARVAAENAAKAEQARKDAEHEEALAAERKRAEQAEADAQAERDRAAAAQRKREAEEKAAREETDRLAEEQAKRDRNRAHVTRVMTEVKEALMSCGADEETAKKIVLAIKASEIPHITVRF